MENDQEINVQQLLSYGKPSDFRLPTSSLESSQPWIRLEVPEGIKQWVRFLQNSSPLGVSWNVVKNNQVAISILSLTPDGPSTIQIPKKHESHINHLVTFLDPLYELLYLYKSSLQRPTNPSVIGISFPSKSNLAHIATSITAISRSFDSLLQIHPGIKPEFAHTKLGSWELFLDVETITALDSLLDLVKTSLEVGIEAIAVKASLKALKNLPTLKKRSEEVSDEIKNHVNEKISEATDEFFKRHEKLITEAVAKGLNEIEFQKRIELALANLSDLQQTGIKFLPPPPPAPPIANELDIALNAPNKPNLHGEVAELTEKLKATKQNFAGLLGEAKQNEEPPTSNIEDAPKNSDS